MANMQIHTRLSTVFEDHLSDDEYLPAEDPVLNANSLLNDDSFLNDDYGVNDESLLSGENYAFNHECPPPVEEQNTAPPINATDITTAADITNAGETSNDNGENLPFELPDDMGWIKEPNYYNIHPYDGWSNPTLSAVGEAWLTGAPAAAPTQPDASAQATDRNPPDDDYLAACIEKALNPDQEEVDGTINPAVFANPAEYANDGDDGAEEADADEGEEEEEAPPPPPQDEASDVEAEELAPPPSPAAPPPPSAAATSEPNEEPTFSCGRCDEPDDDFMVACDNEARHDGVQWFHHSCVGVTEETVRGVDWLCPDCAAEDRRPSPPRDSSSPPPPPPAAPTQPSQPQQKEARKRSGWSAEEDKWCMTELPRIDAELKQDPKSRIDDLWPKVSQYLKERYGMDRGTFAIRNQWIRRLRQLSGYDERRAPNPNNMRTSLLPSSTTGNKKRTTSGDSANTASTADSSAPASKKQKTTSTTPARPASSSSAPTSSTKLTSSSAPSSSARAPSGKAPRKTFAGKTFTGPGSRAPPASEPPSDDDEGSPPPTRPTLGGKSFTGPGSRAVLPGTARKAPMGTSTTQEEVPSTLSNRRKRRVTPDDEDDDDFVSSSLANKRQRTDPDDEESSYPAWDPNYTFGGATAGNTGSAPATSTSANQLESDEAYAKRLQAELNGGGAGSGRSRRRK